MTQSSSCSAGARYRAIYLSGGGVAAGSPGLPDLPDLPDLGLNTLDDVLVDAVKVPVLANITEFGKTPLFSVDDLRSGGVSMVPYPLSAFRAGRNSMSELTTSPSSSTWTPCSPRGERSREPVSEGWMA
jgi:2-methylisocitrate lyase-like PEP mutase family enzyme